MNRALVVGAAVAAVLGLIAMPLVLPLLVVVALAGVAETEFFGVGASCVGLEEVGLDEAQQHAASAIYAVGTELEVGQRGLVIAVTTALAESQMKVLANDGTFTRPELSLVMNAWQWQNAAAVVRESLNFPHDGIGRDWDSVGIFQQRPSAGWGSVENLMDSEYSARAFFGGPSGPNGGSPRGLLDIPSWDTLGIGAAAQRVQVSAFPDAYDRYVEQAAQVVAAMGEGACVAGQVLAAPNADGWVHPVPGTIRLSSPYGLRLHPIFGTYTMHWGTDLAAPEGTAILAPAAGDVVHTSCDFYQGRSPCNVVIDHGGGLSSLLVHMWPHGVHVQAGDSVDAGQHVADVGNNGNSTGPHLHYELWRDGAPTSPEEFFASVGINLASP